MRSHPSCASMPFALLRDVGVVEIIYVWYDKPGIPFEISVGFHGSKMPHIIRSEVMECTTVELVS